MLTCAYAAAPCLIFLDELQAAFALPSYSEDGGRSAASSRLVSQLKLQLDTLSRQAIYLLLYMCPRTAVYVCGAQTTAWLQLVSQRKL